MVLQMYRDESTVSFLFLRNLVLGRKGIVDTVATITLAEYFNEEDNCHMRLTSMRRKKCVKEVT